MILKLLITLMLGLIHGPADVGAPAVRVDDAVQVTPTAPSVSWSAPEGLDNCDEMRWYRAKVGLPARFDSIGWRESNCRNEDGVRTFCCYGYWQLHVYEHMRYPPLAAKYRACGVTSHLDINSDTPADKLRQACAAKAVLDVQGIGAWSTR